MKNGTWVIGLFICFFACSKPADEVGVDPDGVDGPKNVTALLNDSTWYARGNTARVTSVSGDACTTNKFNLNVLNELPYPKGARLAHSCIGNCNTTQELNFTNIPLSVGRYDVAGLNACAPNRLTTVNYGLLIGGDAVFSSYYASEPNSGWIEVTRADTVAKVVEGKFELTLLSTDKVRTVRFRNGRFLTRLVH